MILEKRGIRISMDDSGSYADNLFIERLLWTLKYEVVYLKAYPNAREAQAETGRYIRCITLRNCNRP
jgi:putative transposase